MVYLDPEFSPLPEGWTAKVLSDVVEIHNTKRQPLNGREREDHKGSYPYCGANGVVDYIDDYRFDGEYVLIAEDGGYWGKHQPTSYIMRGKFWVNNHAHVVCAIPTETTNTYFSNVVNYLNIDPFIGGDARGKLTKAILTQLAIPLPSLPEQKKIAHILSTVQRAIEAQERIIQTTTELKKALMHKLFTEGIRNEPQKLTEIGLVPESWKVVEFNQFSTLQRGKDLTKAQFKDGDVPVAGSNGVIGFHDTATCAGPGVTVGRSGSAGKVIFYAGDFWAHNTSLYVRDFQGNLPRYVAYFLEYLDLARFKTGASVPTLDRNSFKNIPVPVPPISEQSEIAEALATTDRKTEIAMGKRASLQGLFRTLLYELMTAKTRVHKLEITA